MIRSLLRSPVVVALAAVALVLGAAFAAPPTTDADTKAWFDGRYEQRIINARTPEARTAIAIELAKFAADREADQAERAKVLYAAKMAHELGKDDYPNGYRAAAMGLMTLQKIDRPNRLQYTEQLADMMESVWAAARTKRLGAGMELAHVKVQVAQQRLADLFAAANQEEPESQSVHETLAMCRRDYLQAGAVARAVLGTAKSYVPRVSGAAKANLVDFLSRHESIHEQIRQNQSRLGDFAVDYRQYGAAAFPTPNVVDPKTALAERLNNQPSTEPPATTPDAEPDPQPDPPAVAAADPEPRPEPRPDPDPPAVAAADPPAAQPDPRPVQPRPARKTVWQQLNCTKCNEEFVPEFGSEHTTCYWCRKKDNIFDAN